jgi:signal transduction histidine kinase
MDLLALAAALELLVLERREDGLFVRATRLPAWAKSLASHEIPTSTPFDLDRVFPFLAAFAVEAADAWRDDGGIVASEFWTEVGAHGEEVHLQARALRVHGTDALVVMRSNRLFEQQRLVLQRARELRLTHAALMREIEQKDILVHAIVHDLAAPLHGILGALSLLNEQSLGEPSAQWIRLSLQAAMRQRQLIGEILDVFSLESGARPEAGDDGLPDACKVVDAVLDELTPAADRQSVRFDAHVDRTSKCLVAAEETRLFRVLSNLVDNALRHSPRGSAIEIATTRTDHAILVTVDDRGPGVPEKQVPRLFEKFARGRGGGTAGLGLYFCRITVERWGGAIGYEPREGGGARFWLRLPISSVGGDHV